MQYFKSNGITDFGAHKGKLFLDLPRQYVKWAKRHLPGFRDQLKKVSKIHSKHPHKSPAPWTSSCGNGSIANKGLRQPRKDRFTSKSKRIVGATLDAKEWTL